MGKLIEVNLIRSHAATSEIDAKNLTHIRFGYLGCFLIFIGMVIHGLVVSAEISAYRKKIDIVTQKIIAERTSLAVENLEVEWKNYVKQLTLVDAVMGKRTQISTIFSYITKTLPLNAVLNLFSIDTVNGTKMNFQVSVLPQKKAPGTTEVTGVMDFMESLKTNTLFGKDVTLQSQEKVLSGDKETTAELFKITVTKEDPNMLRLMQMQNNGAANVQ